MDGATATKVYMIPIRPRTEEAMTAGFLKNDPVACEIDDTADG